MHKDIECKLKDNAVKLSKIQNNALENELRDCKAECKLKDGCVGFMFLPSSVCVNVAYIDLKKCNDGKGYGVYINGRYMILLHIYQNYSYLFFSLQVKMIRLPAINLS